VAKNLVIPIEVLRKHWDCTLKVDMGGDRKGYNGYGINCSKHNETLAYTTQKADR